MKRVQKLIAVVFVFCFILTGCISSNKEVSKKPEISSQKLTEDYYEAVNGDFLTTIEIAPDEREWNQFYALNKESEDQITGIIKELAGKRSTLKIGSEEQKIVDLYKCILDKESRKKAGLGDLSLYTDAIQNASTIQEYAEVLSYIGHEIEFWSLIPFAGDTDMADSTKYAWYVLSSELGPGKELFEDETQKTLMDQYQNYIARLLELGGLGQASSEIVAADIFAFQKDLASAALPLSENGNPDMVYNPYTADELQNLFSNIHVAPILEKAGISDRGVYIVMDENLEKKVNEYLQEAYLPLLKNYSIFCLLNDFAKYLTPDIQQAKMDWERMLYGYQEDLSAERDAYFRLNETFGFELGRLYTERYFSENDKENIITMIDSIIDVYKGKIQNLDWMSEETKKSAMQKLNTMTLKIGYPDKWPDNYRNGKVIPVSENGCLINNMIRLNRAKAETLREKFSSDTVDRDAWDNSMPPQIVNAYYNPFANEIVFPAGILQSPFYSKDASLEKNLGGIGTVIAHEVSHAFDNNGSLYDENGNYSDWWTTQDKASFQKRTDAVVEYYNKYEGMPGRKVNGAQTLGENIADLAGVSCVTDVLLKDCGSEGITDTVRERLQNLYQSYAKIWVQKRRDEYAVYMLNTDPHAPAKVRVNAVLSSTDGFYLAYPELKKGMGMYQTPENRVKIW